MIAQVADRLPEILLRRRAEYLGGDPLGVRACLGEVKATAPDAVLGPSDGEPDRDHDALVAYGDVAVADRTLCLGSNVADYRCGRSSASRARSRFVAAVGCVGGLRHGRERIVSPRGARWHVGHRVRGGIAVPGNNGGAGVRTRQGTRDALAGDRVDRRRCRTRVGQRQSGVGRARKHVTVG